MKKISGIYKIQSSTTGKVYIGSSLDILRRLPEVLSGALKKYGHMTNEELDNYKMNHGCNMSKY